VAKQRQVPQRGRYLTGEAVFGENQNVKTRGIWYQVWDCPGKIVLSKVNHLDQRAVEKSGRDASTEAVVLQGDDLEAGT
jgi:hypothetical protein